MLNSKLIEGNTLLKGYRPNWKNRPQQLPPLLLLGGQKALTAGNIAILCAHSGSGKSHLCESILATAINPNAPNLGVSAHLPEGKSIAYFDCEREDFETWSGWARVMRRAGFPESNDEPSNLIYESLLNLSSEEKRMRIEMVLNESPISLVILDGAADFLLSGDVNDTPDAVETVNWIRKLANENRLGVLAVMHANPTDMLLKPRGHLGAELLRRAEFSFGLEKMPDGSRRLASDFTFGKHRSGAAAETFFHWSENACMFVCCEKPDAVEIRKMETQSKYQNIAKIALSTGFLTYGELSKYIQENLKVSDTTAQKAIKKMREDNFLVESCGAYRLSDPTQLSPNLTQFSPNNTQL